MLWSSTESRRKYSSSTLSGFRFLLQLKWKDNGLYYSLDFSREVSSVASHSSRSPLIFPCCCHLQVYPHPIALSVLSLFVSLLYFRTCQLILYRVSIFVKCRVGLSPGGKEATQPHTLLPVCELSTRSMVISHGQTSKGVIGSVASPFVICGLKQAVGD